MTRRVLLHVGTPKTGTSYLQDVLFRNRERLLEHGLLYPADRFDAHFLAALDLMRLPWGGLEVDAQGCWDALAARARAHDGTTVISHEILARATPAQVDRALGSLVGGDGEAPEVHLLVSARDLVRQIPAEWQENVKHRATLDYTTFLSELRDPGRSSRIASWFWAVQEVPDILARWGASLPPERVHVITVPPPGGSRTLLWERFSAAFGLDDLDLDLDASRANPSLGVAETALLRRINVHSNKTLPPAHYRPLVRELLAHQTLSQRTGSPRLSLPHDLAAWVLDLEQRWVEELRGRGYDVVGDLADLVGAALSTYVDPDDVDPVAVADAAVCALGAVLADDGRHLDEVDRLRRVEHDLHRELDDVRAALERSYLRPSYLARERIVHRLEHGRTGRVLMTVYRGARGRSSRSA